MKKTVLTIISMMAFIIAQASVIPDGKEFRIGKLDNGLTYYLCHNENPAGCADFFIAHNVGALQEEDNQNGLAHFLEHMAFNGTAHYPEKGLLEFLAKEGVRFGYNVNAYTSRTETVYNISKVPLVRESFVDSVLLVLRDWSCDISCEQKALDDERGVIHEEWRRRDDQRYRMANKQTELLFKGGKQPQRTVLGDMDVVLNFKREEILDFYHKWYRPDLQAIIVIGDYDIDDMETRIKKTFSNIPATVNPEKKGFYAPADIPGPRFEDMTDHKLRYTAFKMFCKQPYPQDRGTVEFQKDLFARQIITSVASDHLTRKCQLKDSPAKSSVLVLSDDGPYFYVSQFTLTPKKKENLLECMRMACTEAERINRYGISKEEFEQAKFNVKKKDKLTEADANPSAENTDIAKACVQSFLQGYPCLTPDEMRIARKDILESMTYEEVLPYASKMFNLDEAIYSDSYDDADSASMPTAEQMRAMLDTVKASEINPDFIEYEGLSLDVRTKSGKIVKEESPKGTGYKCWTLSNGAKVWFCKSQPVKGGMSTAIDFRYDTGLNAFPDEDVASVKFATSITSRYCGFSGKDKATILESPVTDGINASSNSIKGRFAAFDVLSTSGKEEDAFKYAYLWLTDPYPCKEANLQRAKFSQLQDLSKERLPEDMFNEREERLRYGAHPWLANVDSAAVEKVDMGFLKDVMDRLYGDPQKLTVYICSDMDESKVRSYVERYIASLPQRSIAPEKARHSSLKPVYTGETKLSEGVSKKTSPFTEVEYAWKIKTPGKQRTLATCDILDYIMSARYLARIREERGGTYHVAMNSEIFHDGKKSVLESIVSFRTRPDLKYVLISDVKELMDEMCASGPTEDEMGDAVKYLVKYNGEKDVRIANSVRLQNEQMMRFARYNELRTGYADVIRGVKPVEVQKLARKINSGATLEAVYEEE